MQARTDAMAQPGTGSSDVAHVAASAKWTDLIAPLSPQQRAVATLYYAEDQSVADVAETLEIAVGTVKSALSKARDNLRRTLGPNDGTASGEARA